MHFEPGKDFPADQIKNLRILLWYIRGDKAMSRFALDAKIKIGSCFVIDSFKYCIPGNEAKSNEHPFEYEVLIN